MQNTIVKTYKGSQSETSKAFQADAIEMSRQGYQPINQSWMPGSYGTGAFIVAFLLCFLLIGFIVFIYMLIVKPAGTLTVTYALSSSQSAVSSSNASKARPVGGAEQFGRAVGGLFSKENRKPALILLGLIVAAIVGQTFVKDGIAASPSPVLANNEPQATVVAAVEPSPTPEVTLSPEMRADLEKAQEQIRQDNEKLLLEKRKATPDKIELHFLNKGIDVRVSTKGKDHAKLRITGTLVSRVFAHKFMSDSETVKALASYGFKEVQFYSSLAEETYTYDL